MTRAVATALTEARSLIERGWVQGHFAVNAKGEGVHPLDPSAVAFCLRGAIDAVTREDGEVSCAAADAMNDAADTPMLALFNDTHTKEEVLGVFDKAIESVGVPA